MSIDVLAGGLAKALSGDRKQFNLFFDKMLDGFAYHKIVVDKSGKPVDYVFIEFNHAFERMTGHKRGQIIGKKVTDVLVGIEKDPTDWIGIYGKVALTGEPIQFENHVESLDKWFRVSAYCPEKGYFVALFEDITKLKKTEEELKRSEENACQLAEELRKLMDIIPAAVWLSRDPECKVIVGNQAANSFYEAEGEENVSAGPVSGGEQDTARRFFQNGKELMPHELPMQEAAAKNIEIKNSELEVVVPSGRKITILGNAKPLLDEVGNVRGCIGAFVDITERKKAEEAFTRINEELEARVQKRTNEVSSERQRLYNVLETLPAYVVLLDKDYYMPFANKVFRDLFGESHGRRCYEFLFGYDSECENCDTYKVLKTNKPQHWEWTGPNKHDYEIYDYPFVDANGSTLILEMGIDVTERKRAERQAQEAAKKLQDAERLAAIGATAGMVGHDIRNPLQSITSELYLAKTDLVAIPESEEKTNIQESLSEIEKNVDYINKIVADLQDFAKPLKPNLGETDLKLIIEQLLKKNGLPDNIEVSVKVEIEASKVVADSTFINRIMNNLVNNAVQAMPKGGKLTIHAYKEENDTIITVKDSGVGIPEVAKGKLFTPMFTTKAKGQGFGLAVVKRLTEALGGTVTFESEEGKGTTFTIRLPSSSKK